MYESNVSNISIKIIANENRVTDISKIFTVLKIRESMDISAVNGEIIVEDDLGAYLFIPIIGQELVSIEFESSGRITTINGFIYKVSDFKKTSKKRSQYTLYFCSYEQCVNQNRRVTRSFQNMTASDIMIDILRNDLGSEKPIVVESSYGDINYIAGNITPFKAVSQLLKVSVSVNEDHSNYVFFENRFGFNIAPLSSFLSTSPSFTYLYGDIGNEIDSPTSFFNIETFQYVKHTDTLDSVTRGMFASQLHTIDLISRDIKTTDYSYLNEFNSMGHLNNLPLYKNIPEISHTKGNQYFDYVDNGTVGGNEKNEYVKSFDPNMLTIESSKTRLRSIIQTSMMDAYVCRMTIPGNISLFPSIVISLSFPAYLDDGNVDPALSGNALITSVNHLITGDGSYTQNVESLMDSHI